MKTPTIHSTAALTKNLSGKFAVLAFSVGLSSLSAFAGSRYHEPERMLSSTGETETLDTSVNASSSAAKKVQSKSNADQKDTVEALRPQDLGSFYR